ncbi:carboxypeptidase D-like isoform X3 [Daphnia pulex]|uniref:carboxypeptidase D-like isoform X3 n=1 Tax=Daphnia pulex TaxID=6669 RepID=UPI001EDE75CB|nr:carboxypeptidase D-like isoform X3 [Daphnia pulex]XP_046652396.1 carboxypeptidase D-like isoform X3 [Daphnia pulicaria]
MLFCKRFTRYSSGGMMLALLALSLLAIGHEAASVSPILTDEETFTSSEYYSSVESEINITPPPPAVPLDFVYHNYTALTDFLRNVSYHYPGLTHLYSIGQSVLKKELWVLAVSSTPDRHVAGKPEMKYVGNIHGNEPVSKEILLHLILHLVSGYGHDPVITLLLDHSRIHFLVSMNPDGFEKSSEGTCSNDKGRKNQKDYDLNRNFPDHFQHNHFPLQPETRAVIQWMSKVPFVLSAGLHGGALVASYPYENQISQPNHMLEREENPTPDDDVFRHLAAVYAKNHATMWMGKPCKPKSESFVGGIVNGAKWYTFVGGMQDYNYIFHGTMEITLEVSCCKHPMASTLRQHWLDNRKALILYMYEALRGVKGFVMDEESGLPVGGAQMSVKGRHREFNTTADGEYWRILLNGSYILQVSAEGYESYEEPFEVMGDEATVLNVTLRRLAPAVNVGARTARTGSSGISLHFLLSAGLLLCSLLLLV